MHSPSYFLTRLNIIRPFFFIGISVILLRLIYLQIIFGDYFFHKSQQNFLRIETVYSPRGNIYDCNGSIIATNRPITLLFWNGSGNHQLNENQRNIIEKLQKIVDQTLDHQLFAIEQAEKNCKRMLLAYDISHDCLGRIEEQLPSKTNLVIETHFERFYPYKQYACHVLGYLSKPKELNSFGQMGLEKLYENILQGNEGKIKSTINSTGKQIKQKKIKNAESGLNIKTTLDLTIQDICEKIFPQSYSGTCIVMDPKTGAIRGLVSKPTFDPDLFLSPIDKNSWNYLQKNQSFLNRALNACYPPGSIFKLVTIAAALDEGIITNDYTNTCLGFIQFGNRKYWCNRKWGHGKLNIGQALAQSCNIPFYEIGKKLSVDCLASYAKKFGLGQPTNITLPEKSGLIPTKEWKLNIKNERWWPGETVSVAIGQSFVLTTPIQIARMIGSIFTGYLVKPRLLENECIEYEECQIKPATRNFLKQSMHAVVKQGTGRRVANINDIKIYAKTSTAQTSTMGKRSLGEAFLEHGWFVAHFKYKNQPPFILVILVEHAGSSRVSTIAAKNFLIAYKEMIDRVPDK